MEANEEDPLPAFERIRSSLTLYGKQKGYTFKMKQEAKIVEFAAWTEQDCNRWVEYFQKEPAKNGIVKKISGFLWIRPPGKENFVKNRQYCISNHSRFECFDPSSPDDIKYMAIKKIECSEGKLEHYIDFGATARRSFHLRKVRAYPYSVSLFRDQNYRLLHFSVKSREKMDGIASILSNRAFPENTLSDSRGNPSPESVATPRDTVSQILLDHGIEETPQINQLRSKMQELIKKGKDEAGKTFYGDYDTTKRMNDGKIRVLSLDGGGLRAIIQVVILGRLVRTFPDLLQRIDVFAGVSGGAIVAAFLACGKTPFWIHDAWMELGPLQFDVTKGSTLGGISVRQAKYSSDMLLVVAAEVWKTMTLAQVPKQFLCLSFLLDNRKEGNCRSWEPKVYLNIPESEDKSSSEPFLSEEDRHKTIADVVLSSGAAPTYFPSHDRHIDGGVFANDPTISAVVALLSPGLKTPTKQLTDIRVLSIGTGNKAQYIEGETHDWGIYQWTKKGNKGGRQLTELMKAAPALHSQWSTAKLLGDNYHRVNPPFVDKVFALDDPGVLPDLVRMACEYNIDRAVAWVRKHFYDDVKDEKPTSAKEEAVLSTSPPVTSPVLWRAGRRSSKLADREKESEEIYVLLKALHVRGSESRWGEDMYEIPLPRDPSKRTYALLLKKVANELRVAEEQVLKIRKIPDALIDKDEHVARLSEGSRLEAYLVEEDLEKRM